MANSTRPDQFAAVVLLAGGRSMAALTDQVGRSPLDLPIDQLQTLGTSWRDQVSALAGSLGVPGLELLVVGGREMVSTGTQTAAGSLRCRVSHIPDPSELRGTGGLLRDVADRFADEQFLLVSTGSTILLNPLDQLFRSLLEAEVDVAFLARGDEAFNVTLVRCGALRDLPSIGFVDFKEQAIPRIKADRSVAAVHCSDRPSVTMRNGAQYLDGLRLLHMRLSAGRAGEVGPVVPEAFREEWRPTFAIIEEGAVADSSAIIHDSVIMRGAKVGRRAIVARSLISPGMVVADDAVVVSRVLPQKGGVPMSDGRRERS